MVTCQLTGGFGNQLCQISAVIAYALDHEMPFCIPTATADSSIWPEVYFKWCADPYGGEGLTIKKTTWDWPYKDRDWIWHKEPDNQAFKEIAAYPYVQLRGHFHSYKYWQKYIPHIHAFLHLNIPSKELHDFYKPKCPPNSCAIHVRRGDYLKFPVKHPVVTVGYIFDAIKYAFEKNIKVFHVFSDDIAWCRNVLGGHLRKALTLIDVSIEFHDPVDTAKDWRVMAGFDHHIISNSSYGSTAALFRNNSEGIVIAPATWTLEPRQVWDTSDIVPPHWVKI